MGRQSSAEALEIDVHKCSSQRDLISPSSHNFNVSLTDMNFSAWSAIFRTCGLCRSRPVSANIRRP
jgi:hypothetical protein